MNNQPIIIEDYNDKWGLLFAELHEIYTLHLNDLILAVEHVGSTAVPGLAAKPILDIDIVIESASLLPRVIDKLGELGYVHEGNLGIEGREAFARIDSYAPYTHRQAVKMDHHLYVCEKDSQELRRHLNFRNMLRRSPQLVDEYARLKKHLAVKFRNDRQAYTEWKSLFVTKVLNMYKESGESL